MENGIHFTSGERRFYCDADEARGLRKGTGLIFRTRETRNLIFTFKSPSRVAITSVFVFFPFLAVWLDEGKNVIESRMVDPFEMSVKPQRDAKYLVELPMNDGNADTISQILNPKKID